MTRKEIEIEARLHAIEMAVSRALALSYRGYAPEVIKDLHEIERSGLAGETFQVGSPEMSDHISGELEQAVAKLQAMIEEYHLRAWQASQRT